MSEKIMRASRVGFPCNRYLWYSITLGYKENIPEKTQRTFEIGTAIEPLVVKWLICDGWGVIYNPGSQNASQEIRIPVNSSGYLSGHFDAIISKNNENILIDIKTMNDRAFRIWRHEGTIKKYPQYVDQLHVYAYGVQIFKLGIVGVNKNTSELHMDFFEYDENRMSEIIKRTENIFEAQQPPEPGERMQDWCCSYCGYSHLCGIAQKKKDTSIGEKVIVTDDEEVISAIEQLNFARNMKSEYEELETEAKDFLNEHVRKKGIKAIKGGNLILTLKECKSKDTFDVKGFTNFNPELAKQFTTNGNSYVKYEIKEA